jgi:hypothetical protein
LTALFNSTYELDSQREILDNTHQYMKDILGISSAQLKRIIVLKEKIEKLQSQLQAFATNLAPAGEAAPKKRTMSLSARRKIAAAARARWAKVRAEKEA